MVPIFNCEKYISRCIDSILNQSFCDFELILVDDGSKDNSIKICSGYNDKRIKIISHEKNLGVVAARDSALEASIGQYITWVDSDDYIDSNRLEKLYDSILKDGVDIVVTGYIHEFSNGKSKRFLDKFSGHTIKNEEYENIKPHIFEFNNKTGMRNVHTILWNKAIKRELLMLTYSKIPQSLVIGDDTPRTYVAMLGASSASFLYDFSYHYMENPGQLMKTGYRETYFENALQIYLLIEKINKEFQLSSLDISYEISQNILITAVFAIAKERNNPNKTAKKANIKQICNNDILLDHISKKIIKKQNPYFQLVLNWILKKNYKALNIYLLIYKFILG